MSEDQGSARDHDQTAGVSAQEQVDRHTPGPWRIEGHTTYAGGVTGKMISHGINEHQDGPAGYVAVVLKAAPEDLRLMLGAPELLAAARQALWHIGSDDDRHAMDAADKWQTSELEAAALLRAAITQAELRR